MQPRLNTYINGERLLEIKEISAKHIETLRKHSAHAVLYVVVSFITSLMFIFFPFTKKFIKRV